MNVIQLEGTIAQNFQTHTVLMALEAGLIGKHSNVPSGRLPESVNGTAIEKDVNCFHICLVRLLSMFMDCQIAKEKVIEN